MPVQVAGAVVNASCPDASVAAHLTRIPPITGSRRHGVRAQWSHVDHVTSQAMERLLDSL